MKKLLSMLMLSAALLVPWASRAQDVVAYTFATGTDASTWVTLSSSATAVTSIYDDDAASSVMNIGFTFTFAGANYTQWSCNSNGRIALGATAVDGWWTNPFTATNLANTRTVFPLIAALGMDNTLEGSGVWCKYEVVGTAPNRMLVIEYRTPSEYDSEADLVNYQIQLEEGTNVVRFVYGATAASTYDDFQAGMASATDDVVTVSSTHTMMTGATSTVLSAWPGVNRYYEFTPPTNFCARPASLTVTNVSEDEIAISWEDYNNSSWLVAIGNDAPVQVTDTFYTFTNLSSNTNYTIAVASLCSSGDTSAWRTVTVRTACSALANLPYSYGFEDAATGSSATFPACWNRINDASGTYNYYPYVTTTASYVHSGSNGLYWYHSTSTTYANNEYAILPQVDLNVYDMTDLTLAFWAKTTSTSYHPQPIIGVMTDPTDASTFTPVQTLSATAITTDWQMFDVSFANYTGTGSYIAIKWPRTSSLCYMAIDDIYLTDSWCNMPGNLTASATADSVVLSWDPNGGSSFEVIFNGDTVSNITDTFYIVDNLTSNTLYTYSVANMCAGGNSMYATGSIRTLCVALDSLPYVQDFEGATTGGSTNANFVNCMYRLNNGTTYFGYPYVGGSTYNHTTGGSKGLYWYNCTTTGTYGDYQIVVLPPVDTNTYPINNLKLTFWARPSTTSYYPQFQVGVMTNPNDASTFEQVGVVSVANTTTWQKFTTMFGSYNGQGQFVAIRAVRPSSSWYAYLDDITLEPLPACPAIVSHHTTATASSAFITWATEQGFPVAPDSYVVNYSPVGDSLNNATTVTVTEPTLSLTGLEPDSTYMVSIYTSCTEGNGAAYTFTFHTVALPCLEWDTTNNGPMDTLNVTPQGTSTTYYMPVNNSTNYSYCQHLVRASDINVAGPVTIGGIGFEYAYTQPMTHATTCSLYVAYTTQTTLSSMVPYNDLQLVYVGPLNCTTNGWNYFQFNQGTFQYDGTSNFVVAIVNNSGSSDGSSYVFKYNQPGVVISRREGGSTPYTPEAMNAATGNNSNWRTNMQFLTGGGDCITAASCSAPAVFAAKDNTGNVEVSWLPGYQETSWDLDYKAEGDTVWTNILTGTSNTDYTILMSSLLANTKYTFRVTANCSDTNIAATATYTTPCSFISIPYFYGFEDMATGSSSAHPNIPCWHHLNNATSYYGYPYVSSTAHNSSRSLYWYLSTTAGTYGDYEVVVLPPVDTTINPINTLQLSFWARPTSTNYAPVFYVGVMSDPENVNTFQYVDTVYVAHTTTDWNFYESNLDNYIGNGEYVAIRANRPSSSYYVYLDDVTLSQIPICARVDNIGATNITDSSATIYWDTTSSTDYDVQYGPTGFAVGSGTMVHVTDVDSVDISGLIANTAYDVYVRGNCAQDSGTWSFVYTFRTACVAFSIPYTEGFESYSTGSTASISPCWVKGTSSSTAYPYPSATAPTGSRSLYFYAYHPSSTTTTPIYSYAALPAFQEPLNTLQMDFKVRTYSTASNYYYTYLVVGVMSNPADISTFTAVDTINLAGATASSVHDISVSFGSYTGNGQYIAIYDPVTPLVNNTTYAYSYAYVDDIVVDFLPACPRVEQLIASPLLTSATISWEDTSSTNTSWYVEYDTVAFAPGTGHMTPILVTDTFAVLTGLDSATLYHVYVYPDCDTHILFRHITFHTLAASPATVPYYCDFEAAGINGWDIIGGQNYWMVGNATNNGGNRAMYVTNNGSANAYTTSVISYSYAVRAFNLTDTGEYAYAYDWKGVGESHYYDFTRVFLTPASETFDAATVLGGSTYSFSTAACPAGWFDLTQSGGATPNTMSQQSTWQSVSGTFVITTPGTYKMVFIWANDGSGGTNPPTAIDNVSLAQLTCPQPQNVNVTNTTTSTITIDWTDVTPAPEWQVEYTGNGVTNVTTVVAHPVTLSNLLTATAYSIRVRPICGAGDTSFWTPAVSVATECGLVALPYFENFDNYTGTTYSSAGIMPNCWDAYSNGTSSAYNPHITGSGSYWYPHSNPNALTMTSGSSSYGDTKIVVLPPFDQPLTNLSMTYWYKMENATNGSTLYVGYVTDSNYNTSFVPIKTVTSTTTLTRDSVSFDSVPATATRIAFKWYYNTSFYSVGIDDIEVTSSGPSCPAPTNLTATSVTYNAATITWSGSDSTEVGIHQGLWDESGATMTNVTPGVHTYTFTGLTPNTQYTVAARTLCEDNMTSNWTFVTFTTDDLPCFAPTNIQVSNETTNGGKITWTPGGNETEWIVNVFRTGIIDTNITVINTPMCNVSGLYAATSYTVSVGSVCGGIDTVWCDVTATLTTTACLPPTNVTAVANGRNAMVTWTSSGANEYHVLWFLEGFTSGADSVVVTNGTTNATIENLEPGESYDIFVYAYCDGQRSAQAGEAHVTITGIDDVNSSLINLYPNPANTTVTVDGIQGEALVTIVDMNGRTVYSEKAVGKLTIDLGGMAQGAYFVRITGENTTAIRKLIVK